MVLLVPAIALFVVVLLVATHAWRSRSGATPFTMMLASGLLVSIVSLMFPNNRALAAALLMSVQAGLLVVLVLEGRTRWRSTFTGLVLLGVGGLLCEMALLVGLPNPGNTNLFASIILEQAVYTLTFLLSAWMTAMIYHRLDTSEPGRAMFFAFLAGSVAQLVLINLVLPFQEALAVSLALHAVLVALTGVLIAVYANALSGRVAPAYRTHTALLRTIEALAQQSTGELWPHLLESAVDVVPGAQAGSIWVRHGAVFRVMAQRGFEEALIGMEVLESGFLIWYGHHEGWERLEPRIKSGSNFQNRVQLLRDSFETDRTAFDSMARTDQIRANLCLPIVVGNELLAYINLDAFQSEHAFDEGSIEVARDYVLQATALLASSRARASLETRLHEFEILESVTAALQTARTSLGIAEGIVQEMVSLLDSQHGCAFVISADGEYLEPLAGTGVFKNPGSFRVPRGQGVTWAAIQTHEVILIDDLREETRLYNPDHSPLTIRSQLTVPIFDSSGAPLGALVAARDQVKPYAETDRRAVQVIASVAANALERVQATEALEAKLRETQSLLSLAQLLEGSQAESLGLALEMVRQLGEADVVVLATLENGVYSPRALAGDVPPALTKLLLNGMASDTPAFDTIGSGQALEITDVASHADFAAYAAIGVQSAYLIGMQTEGSIGGLVLLRHTRAGGWTQPQHRMIEATTRMFGALVARLDRLTYFEAAYEGALRAISVALEARDRETAGHTDRVTGLAERIGRELGLNDLELRDLRWGAYLHDIGKLAIPDAILFKPGKLDPIERSVIETHVVIGYQLALDLPFLPELSRNVVRHHHERWDGQGYPDRLVGEVIPLEARIFAVCDVFDALISERPYKKAMSFETALEVLQEGSQRGQFDPRVMMAFEVVAQREWGLRPPGLIPEHQAIPAD
jgi:putative nucleotidyltransferase with HDIG domain